MYKAIIMFLHKRINSFSPAELLIYSFMTLIIIGTVLLYLPFSQKLEIPLIDCLFTATSATCVTGLTTIDMSESFTLIGEIVILSLIQLGGIGVMTFAALSFKILGAHLPMRSQMALENSIFQRNAATDFRKMFNKIVILVLSIETVGALVLFYELINNYSFKYSLWTSIFHSISAFCNAGFSRNSDSLENTSLVTQSVIMILIIAGGLGHIVLVEIANFLKHCIQRKRKSSPKWFSFHVRIVLWTTFILIISGTTSIYFLGLNGKEILFTDALFQSITARTAGFYTVEQNLLTIPAALIMIVLMFIGGSPGSCAGGIKTTTVAIWFAHIRATIRNKTKADLLNMAIPAAITAKARQLVGLSMVWCVFGVIFLSISEDEVDLLKLIYEQVSAFGTVGLSMDFTPNLTEAGKIWITMTMFVGRLGPLTIALMAATTIKSNISHPEGRIMVG